MGRQQRAHEEVRDASGNTPERTCAVTRAKLAPDQLVRFVRAPDGTITPDLAHRLPGRGVWIKLDRAAVEAAAGRNAFARSLKRPVEVPDDLAGLVERLLRDRCVQALAIANKAGLVVSGFAKVEARIAAGSVAALVHAADASPDGAAKLDSKARARARLEAEAKAAPDGDDTPQAPFTRGEFVPEIVADLSLRELSLALGRENVVHAAVIKGGAARYFLTEIHRLRRYRSIEPEPQAGRPRMKSSTEQV
ncbi:MAG: RNA-binding protein [Hyphomicrobiaceae bacterium]